MKKVTLLGFLLVAICSQSRPASADLDFQFWSEFGVKYKLSKMFRFELDGMLRLDDNASRMESFMPELSVTYRVFKFLRFRAGYRYLLKPEYSPTSTDYYSWHRFFFDVRLRYRLKPFTFRYRLRYQEQFFIRPANSVLDSDIFKHTLRNKLQVEFNAGQGFEPFVAGELFIRFGDNDGYLHKWRATFGCDYEYEAHQFSLFYRIEGMLNGSNDPLANILGVSYHYSF
jgi:uncharacterized protein DUF2490